MAKIAQLEKVFNHYTKFNKEKAKKKWNQRIAD